MDRSPAGSRRPPFRPAWWLPGAHLQTLWGPLTRGRRLVESTREVLPTPDGDELVLDHVDGPPGSPRVLLLHGLEGSSNSVYIQGLLALLAGIGWRGTAMNFRSCARDPLDVGRRLPNRRPRFYHSGETADPDFVIRTLAARDPAAPLAAVGASLGGNVLLKWLGENPSQGLVAAAATISTPYDLAAGSFHLERVAGRLYVRVFFGTLKPKAIEVARRFAQVSGRIDSDRIRRARTFEEFDDAATAPLHGFTGAEDYYSRSSSIRFLNKIGTPTLCLSAADDPFLPARVLARARAAASPAVEIVTTPVGGHIGFVSGEVPWRARFWAEETVVSWLQERLRRLPATGPEPAAPRPVDEES